MATVATASAKSKELVTAEHLQSLAHSIGVSLAKEDVEQWRDLVASTQESMSIVQALDDYVPVVDLERFPRQNIHRPAQTENPGNAWAWKAQIDGVADGPLKGLSFCLKDNIAVKGVPMLIGTEVITNFTPEVDASQ